jgi:hypothetical protein
VTSLETSSNLDHRRRSMLGKQLAALNKGRQMTVGRRLRPVSLAVAAPLLLVACDNQYRAPVLGQPVTWGQQHYLDNERYQEAVEQGRAD